MAQRPCNNCVYNMNCRYGHSVASDSTCSKFTPRKNAQSANKPGRNKPAYREYTTDTHIPRPAIRNNKSTGKRNRANSDNPLKPRSEKRIKIGQYLYYKNKFTGVVEKGKVKKVLSYTFVFVFDNRQVTLPFQAVGTRLFRTWDEARLKGRVN